MADDKTIRSRDALWRLRPWLRRYWWALVLMPLSDVTALICMVIIPFVIAHAIDGPIGHRDVPGIIYHGCVVLCLVIAQTAAFALRFYPIPHLVNAEATMRRDLFAHAQRLSVGFHDRAGSSAILSRIIGDLAQVGNYLEHGLSYTASTIASLVVAGAALIYIDPILGSLVIMALSPLSLASKYFRKRFYKAAQTAREQAALVSVAAEEATQAIPILKGIGGTPFIAERFRNAAEKSRNAQVEQIRLSARFNAFMSGYPILVLSFVLFGGVLSIEDGNLSTGTFVAFCAFYFRMLSPLRALGRQIFVHEVSRNALSRVVDLLDAESDLLEKQDAEELPEGGLELSFEDVHFGYPGSETEVLKGVNFSVRAGECVALVGEAGSGKSTIAALAARLFDPTKGQVRLGGVDLRNVKISALRRATGVAFEDALLYSESILRNLATGRNNITENDITHALAVTKGEFVDSLPYGRETLVGERGLTLSGGQRQRLALARALLSQPRLLILDDPLSALDVRTEQAVGQLLRNSYKKTTMLIIARRLSTAKLADRIAVLHDGKIAVTGTHAELVVKSALYRNILMPVEDSHPRSDD